jgi:hypothetical protein
MAHRIAIMTMAGSGCRIDHAETLIAIIRSICEPDQSRLQRVAASGGKSNAPRGKSDAHVLQLTAATRLVQVSSVHSPDQPATCG